MSLRLALASLLLATAISGGCAAPQHISRPIAGDHHAELDRAALRTQLAERRAIVIQRFLAYREARLYPSNNLPGGGTRHVWIDDAGNLCAAATLISQDWGRDATIAAGAADREIQLARVSTGPLLDWILTSGLTRHELVAIQVPGSPVLDGPPPDIERERMYTIYVDVERQLRSLGDRNLELAVDALLARPELARAMLAGRVAGPGPFAVPIG